MMRCNMFLFLSFVMLGLSTIQPAVGLSRGISVFRRPRVVVFGPIRGSICNYGMSKNWITLQGLSTVGANQQTRSFDTKPVQGSFLAPALMWPQGGIVRLIKEEGNIRLEQQMVIEQRIEELRRKQEYLRHIKAQQANLSDLITSANTGIFIQSRNQNKGTPCDPLELDTTMKKEVLD